MRHIVILTTALGLFLNISTILKAQSSDEFSIDNWGVLCAQLATDMQFFHALTSSDPFKGIADSTFATTHTESWRFLKSQKRNLFDKKDHDKSTYYGTTVGGHACGLGAKIFDDGDYFVGLWIKGELFLGAKNRISVYVPMSRSKLASIYVDTNRYLQQSIGYKPSEVIEIKDTGSFDTGIKQLGIWAGGGMQCFKGSEGTMDLLAIGIRDRREFTGVVREYSKFGAEVRNYRKIGDDTVLHHYTADANLTYRYSDRKYFFEEDYGPIVNFRTAEPWALMTNSVVDVNKYCGQSNDPRRCIADIANAVGIDYRFSNGSYDFFTGFHEDFFQIDISCSKILDKIRPNFNLGYWEGEFNRIFSHYSAGFPKIIAPW